MNEEHHYRVLKHLAANPQATRRNLAQALGLSLGSATYCIRAVIDQGWVKVQQIRTSRNNGVDYLNDGGSHYVCSYPGIEQDVCVPAHRPIKPLYVRNFLALLDTVQESRR